MHDNLSSQSQLYTFINNIKTNENAIIIITYKTNLEGLPVEEKCVVRMVFFNVHRCEIF